MLKIQNLFFKNSKAAVIRDSLLDDNPEMILLSVSLQDFSSSSAISLSQSELFPAAARLSLILGRCVLIRSELNGANSSFLLRLSFKQRLSHNHQ